MTSGALTGQLVETVENEQKLPFTLLRIEGIDRKERFVFSESRQGGYQIIRNREPMQWNEQYPPVPLALLPGEYLGEA